MPDSGRGSGGWKFAAVSFACNRGGNRVVLALCCWFVAKNMPGSMVGAVC